MERGERGTYDESAVSPFARTSDLGEVDDFRPAEATISDGDAKAGGETHRIPRQVNAV